MSKNQTAANSGEREEEVKSNWVSWGKEGDTIKGTLIGVRQVKSTMPDKQGQLVNVYEIKASEGSYFEVDKKTKLPIGDAIEIQAGDIYNIGGRAIIDRQMRNIKLGQKIRLTYTETNPARNAGFNDLKVIKVFVVRDNLNRPVMDTEWVAEQENAEAVRTF